MIPKQSRRIRQVVLVSVSVVALGAFLLSSRSVPKSDMLPSTKLAENATHGFAVMELFTSEGCSSCPPADELLGEFVKKADAEHLAIYPLSFHVDYWNSLGWQDHFSSAEFTERQSGYVNAMQLPSAYTPQVIVNGNTEAIGSARDKVSALVNASLSTPAAYSISLDKPSIDGSALTVTVHSSSSDDPIDPKRVINIAVVQHLASTSVKRGENSGRTLHHWNVVRAFKQVNESSAQTVSLELPADLHDPSSFSVIAYLQDRITLKILAATATQ
jgi:hypothetical protein